MLNAALPEETLPGKMQLPFFSSFAAVTLNQTADENGASALTFREEYQTNIRGKSSPGDTIVPVSYTHLTLPTS